MVKWLKRVGVALGLVAVVIAAQFIPIKQLTQNLPSPIAEIGEQLHKVITVGMADVAYAVTPDYVVDGIADDVQAQTALDLLPATGGELLFYSGNYAFDATVLRAINNVTISGSGKATYFSHDGGTALFSTGAQTGWVFRDFRTDAGYLTVSGDTLVETVWNVTTIITSTSPVWVAASTATASEKSTAVASGGAVCDGVADNVQIQAAIDLVAVTNGYVRCVGNNWGIAAKIVVKSSTTLEFPSGSIITPAGNIDLFELQGNARLYGNGSLIDYYTPVKAPVNGVFVLDASNGSMDLSHGTTPFVKDFQIEGGVGAGSGTGIALLAGKASAAYIWGALFDDIKVRGMEYHTRIVASTADNWINGNTFNRCSCDNTVHQLLLDNTGGVDVDSNRFIDFQNQHGANSTDAITDLGNGNVFRGRLWDWAAGSVLIHEDGNNNLFEISGLPDSAAYQDDGLRNTLIDLDKAWSNARGCYRNASPPTYTLDGSGAITINRADDSILVESADANPDNFDQIIGGVAGQTLVIRRASANTITLRDGQVNLLTNGNKVLDSAIKSVTLLCLGTNWVLIAASV